MGSLLAAFAAELGIVTYRVYKTGQTKTYPLPMPLPADYVAIALVFSGVALLNEIEALRPIPVIFSWGLVIATLLNLWKPGLQPDVVQKSPSPGQALAGLFTKPKEHDTKPKATPPPKLA